MAHFIGNFFAEKEVLRWIQDRIHPKTLTSSSILVLIGPVGSGKTHGVLSLCKQLGKTVHMIDSNTVENFKAAREKIVKLTSANVATQFQSTQRSDQVIMVDAMETLLTMDRSFLHSFQKLLDTTTLPTMPVIITVQTIEKKRVLDAFANATVIELNIPNDADMLLLLRRISNGSVSVELLSDIVTHSCGNISVALHMLEMEKVGKDAEPGLTAKNSKNNVDKISTLSDVYIHSCPRMAYYVFCEDPWLHPLRFHENLLAEWSERKGIIAKKQQVYLSLMKDICTWDMFMSHFKGADLQIPTDFIAHSVHHLRSLERKKNANPPADEFTKMFSHLSLEKKNSVAAYESEYDTFGSYYKSVADQIYRPKKTKKSFLGNV
jgi:hypothetical protein